MDDGRDFLSTLTICVLYFSYLLAMDRIGLFMAFFCSLINLWAGKVYFRLQEKARLEKLSAERERDYQHRVYIPAYFMLYAIYLPILLYQAMVLKSSSLVGYEPSSALDPASEYQLNQELRQIAEDKTVIFISHRLATVRDADCIYMMKEGAIVEQGTNDQLLKLGGKYSRMWEMQTQAYW